MLTIGQQYTLTEDTTPEAWRQVLHVYGHGITDQPTGTATDTVTLGFPDGCRATLTESQAAQVAAAHAPATSEPTDPDDQRDPLETWEANCVDPDRVRAAIWERADAAADDANACSEYEGTVHHLGHEPRPGKGYDDPDADGRGEGDVTFTRIVERTVRVTQTVTLTVDAGVDPYEQLEDTYPDWEDYEEETWDESTYSGPDIEEDEREYLEATPADPAPLAQIVREAIDYTDGSWQTIRDAILTVAQEAGAPIRQGQTAGITAHVVRYQPDGTYRADRARIEAQSIDAWEAQQLANIYSHDGASVARNVLRRADAMGANDLIIHGTMTALVRTAWEANA